MNWLKQLNDSLEFVEENITENISCEDVAKEAYSSYHHFMRMFYILSGVNLGEYIRNRRLTLAASDLVTTDTKIIDIALKYQYNTPESFSKAFKRFHGVSPSSARKNHASLKIFPKMSFQLNIKGDNIMDYKIVKYDKLNFVGKVKTFTTNDGQNFKGIPVFWQEVMQDDTFAKLGPHADELGIVGMCYDWDNKTNEFKYMIGVRTDNEIDGMEKATFDSQTFASFKSVGALPNSIQEVIQQVFGEWFPSNRFEHSGGPEIEVYPQGDTMSEEYECFYLAPIKEK